MKTLIKMLFLFAIVIYLNNGDIIETDKIERKWTWVIVHNVTEYKEKQPNLNSYKIRDIKRIKQITLPVTSILRMEEVK